MKNRAKKRFAQHWLKSEYVLNKIIEAAQLNSSDRVLEIGPGTGILTRRLLPYVDKLVAVEIDRDLIKKLVHTFGKEDNFLLLEGDFLQLNLAEYLKQFPNFQESNKVVANIPYNITGLILQKLLGKISEPNPNPYDLIVLLVQKEIGDRLVAKPSTKAYGALSLRVQYLAESEIITPVPAKSFSPPPKVDSVVVRLIPRLVSNPPKCSQVLDNIIKLGFANRRKMLTNNLKSIIEPEKLREILTNIRINPLSRAEDLSLEQWINLSNNLSL
jgi:16S rRNA (adenine1518-N6/adenine1519-N6)-dimethyltransferase